MHYKNRLILMLILAGISISLSSCLNDDGDSTLIGNWVERSDFEGVTRSGAVSFTVGNFAYVGLGFDGDDYLRDFWMYDPGSDFWLRMDTFPGIGRTGAVAFSAGGKGYVGTGFDGENNDELKDFWEFDPNAAEGQQWRQVSDFLGTARYNAVAFALNDKGYVGTGYDKNYLKDFYRYDPGTDTWEQIVSLGGSKREDAAAFVIGNKAYVGTGRNNGVFEFDFWEFDGTTESWTGKMDLDVDNSYTIFRNGAIGFSLNGLGYITTGSSGSILGTVWEYDPATDVWVERTALEGSSRVNAVGFNVSNRLFVTTGRNGTFRFDDHWEFIPTQDFNEDD